MEWITGWEWPLALLGAMLIGISKTGLPGVGILAVPLFAALIPARLSTGVVLPLLILADVFAVAIYRRHAQWAYLLRIAPWTVVGILLGYLWMGRIDDRQLQPIIGVIVLLLLALNAWRRHRTVGELPVPKHPAVAGLIGVLAGVTTMLANAAGPIMIVYLLAMRLPKTVFIGTGAWYFFLLNLFKVPFSVHLGLIRPDTLQLNLILAPAIVAGALLGVTLARKLPERAFARAVEVLALVGALRLLLA